MKNQTHLSVYCVTTAVFCVATMAWAERVEFSREFAPVPGFVHATEKPLRWSCA